VGDTGYVGNGIDTSPSLVFKITGLVSGTVYQYDWAYANQVSESIYISCQGATGIPGGTNTGPATMEVWSA
jgi:hypothetical protein